MKKRGKRMHDKPKPGYILHGLTTIVLICFSRETKLANCKLFITACLSPRKPTERQQEIYGSRYLVYPLYLVPRKFYFALAGWENTLACSE
jgi:hypothetical protein